MAKNLDFRVWNLIFRALFFYLLKIIFTFDAKSLFKFETKLHLKQKRIMYNSKKFNSVILNN
jgi:hypothetical protein